MKIAFLFGKKTTPNVDATLIDKVNPGIGGTEYLTALLIHNLAIRIPDVSILIYHYNKIQFAFEKNIKKIHINNDAETVNFAENDGADVFVYTAIRDNEFYNAVQKSALKCISWVHNPITCQELKMLAEIKQVKRVVFVSRQLYDLFMDHAIFKKSLYIYNMISCEVEETATPVTREKNVVFMGSITKQKGFHVLAQGWKYIKNKVPEAQLYVLGSGKLYDRNAVLGKYGIAEEKYEESFIDGVLDDKGNILDSVHFEGVVGLEKYDYFKMGRVGVVNPTAYTETFCLSAVEMEIMGLPVVTKNSSGFLDTIIHNKTGLLSGSYQTMYDNIIRLLTDDELFNQLSTNGFSFVSNNFTVDVVMPKWINLLNEVIDDRCNEQHQIHELSFVDKDLKWLRIINKSIKDTMQLNTRSIYEIEKQSRIIGKIRYLTNKIRQYRSKR